MTYRSFRTFQKDKYRSDLQQIPFSVCEAFDDPSDALWAQNILIRDVLDQHAPLKTKTVRPFQPPFMNNILRKSIMNKARLRNRYKRTKSPIAWEQYRQQRNKTTKLRRKSIRQYFEERCTGGPKDGNFYKTIKPFLSAKYRINSNMMISTGDTLLTDPSDVATSMNDFFTDIALNIGEDKQIPRYSDYDSTKDFVNAALHYHKGHPSVINIQHMKGQTIEPFTLSSCNVETVSKIIKNLNSNKATGVNGIPAKALKLAYDIVDAPFT